MITFLKLALPFLLGSIASLVMLTPQAGQTPQQPERVSQLRGNSANCRNDRQSFLAYGGGGAPSYNEIALEKNMLYFQRTLAATGYDPAIAPIFFANGTNGKATVRYLDAKGKEKFKVPEIPNLQGASTPANLQRSLQQIAQDPQAHALFFYFTGHGDRNEKNLNNNAMWMWGDQQVSVQQFTQMLDRLPAKMPVVTMMSQCFSGSFANIIYTGGDPNKGVALRTRCGFFATVKTNPSVGCTPEVDEADYRDYSSSFYAGLSGRDRLGKAVPSADYNRDGRVSFAEAHAFAKVDEQTSDLPISTLEAWLQEQSNRQQRQQIWARPIATVVKTARPEQRYVVDTLIQKFQLRPDQSFEQVVNTLTKAKRLKSEADEAYITRLGMELIDISLEQQLRATGNAKMIDVLDRLVKCEARSLGQ
jgi:hypothetical protein